MSDEQKLIEDEISSLRQEMAKTAIDKFAKQHAKVAAFYNFLPPLNEQDVAILLRDALSEFINKRTPEKAYVEKRWGILSPEQQSRKVKQVEQRLDYATRLIEQSSTLAELIIETLNSNLYE